MSTDAPAYGLWGLVLVNSVVFILFAYSFFKPRTKRDWRSFGAFSAFLVALFAEMYGFPLSIYFLSGWLQSRYPGIDWFSHDAGHLLEMMFGWKTNPHTGPFHLLSYAFIFGGFLMISAGWKVLFEAQRHHELATAGIYGVMAYFVTQRTREIGVRVALGAQWSDVLKLILKSGMSLVTIGLTIGLAGALTLTRLMTSLLFEVSPTDPLTFGGVALCVIVATLLACYIPARRAIKVDPLIALRYE